MLAELLVENLLLIERAKLRLGPGLNVLTGETGAGKTVLTHALDLLLGGRPRQGIVRPAADEAYVEGRFLLSASHAKRLREGCPIELVDDLEGEEGPPADLEGAEAGPEAQAAGEMELLLARRVLADGRTRAYLNGRSVAARDLRQIACELIAFHGQHEHRRLADASEQLQILDDFCGPEQSQRRQACSAALSKLRQAQAELTRLTELQAARERELDLLQHELAEIEMIEPQRGERERLIEQRKRARQIDALRAVALLGATELTGDEQEMLGGARLIAGAAARIGQVQGVDARLDELGSRCEALALEAEDLAAELRRYGEQLDSEEGELERLEERLTSLDRLARKHGGDLEAVLAYAEQARARHEELTGAELAASEASKRAQEAEQALQREVKALRSARGKAARKLEARMAEQLACLAMRGATFEVLISECEPTASGGDVIEFMLAPNPGVAAGPLREIASGGELSRTMLALSAMRDSGEAGSRGIGEDTVVFDEVDSGIGGQTARAVGARLRELANGRQVLCITHLPQIAALAQTHFSIAKGSAKGSTEARVLQLSGEEVVGELVRMLGAKQDDAAATRHAEELLSAV